VSVCDCRFWVMPSVMLKNVIMGNLRRPTRDLAIADSIDFFADTVIYFVSFYLLRTPRNVVHVA